MKMHVLTAAVLVALASQAVLAASEGGDTWSAVEPVQQPTYSVLKPPAPAPDAAFGGSEGGDTWSRFEPQLQGQPIGSAGLASGPRFEQR